MTADPRSDSDHPDTDHPDIDSDRDQQIRGTRSIELSIEVPGTPEQVWDAIATGPGVTSWYVPFEVEPRVGGRVTMTFGSFGTEEAVVSAWEPHHRFQYRDAGDGALAYEWLVEARDGGSCVVRLVNSGFGHGEDWDGQYDGMSQGWRIFLQCLRLQLTHHRDERARAVVATVTVPGPHRAALDTFCQRLGLPADLDGGDEVRTGGDVPALGGRVESVLRTTHATTFLLELDQPGRGSGFVSLEGDGDQVAASVYLYLYGAADRAGEDWPDWLARQFPPMTEPLPASAYPSAAD